MSTRTKTPSRTQSTIVVDPEEFEAPGLESGERSAGATAGDLPLPAACARELSQELIDQALDRARLGGGMLELPDGARICDEVIDQLLAGARTEEEIAGPGGLLAQLTKRLVERAMEIE